MLKIIVVIVLGETHIGILSDGTVTICCLDHNGLSDLGNVFNNSLDDILGSEKFLAIEKHFKIENWFFPYARVVLIDIDLINNINPDRKIFIAEAIIPR